LFCEYLLDAAWNNGGRLTLNRRAVAQKSKNNVKKTIELSLPPHAGYLLDWRQLAKGVAARELQKQSERLLPMGQMRKRYGVSDRTIDRWLETGILPQPVRMGQTRFWRLSDLEKIERDRIRRGKPRTTA
jgi:predicted DNA-binding transcriptional regulator AlpA